MAVAIHTEGLTKHYGSTEALSGLDLDVDEAEVFGYLGPNGAGKSTTIEILLGFRRASAGRAEIFGLDVRRDAAELHGRIAYVGSGASLWPSLTGREALRFLANLHGSVDETYRDELLERFQLEADKKVRAYSDGNRQKVLLVAAFSTRADLLLLDEPTRGLDPLMEQVFQECVREAHRRGQTVFLSSHILSEVDAVCDRVAMLRRGRIIETGDLEALRGLASVRVEADVRGAAPDLSRVSGVDHVTVDGSTVHCQVTGPMGPLLAALADAGVERLLTREPSLEELFMARYERDPERDGRLVTTVAVGPGPRSSGAAAIAVHPEIAVARRVARQLRGGALWIGLTFGTLAAASAVTYVQSFPTAAGRLKLAASLRGDSAFSVLFGRIDHIDTVGGYTAYKTYATISTIGAVWGALAATRLLRGEEDAGRWQLVLAGRTNAARTTMATLMALGGAIGVVFAGTAALMALGGLKQGVGTSAVDDLMLGLSATVAPVVFATIGAVCSQLAQTRRLATGLTMGVLGVAFVVRMIADAGPGTRWLLWATPLGWAELVRPIVVNDAWPLLPTALVAVVGGGLAIRLAGRRDTGGGLLASHDITPERRFGLRSPLVLALRLSAPVLAAWTLALGATGFVMGIVAKPAAAALQGSSALTTLHKLGANGSGAKPFFGVVFLLIGAALALVPANQISAAAEEESSGRLGQIVAGRSTRVRWLAGRLALSAVAVAALGLVSGLAAWAGARSQGVHLSVATLLGAGANVVPAALLVLALGALVLSVAPRRAGATVYAVVACSFVIDLLGSLVSALRPLTHLSVFHYVGLVPAQPPSWRALATMTAVALAVALLAVGVLDRRDLVRE